ncbi:hypothetical protein C7M84_023842 [Penaeus vannamei]|uniref:Uncharacterized protein n=1 Tax=Penaeus vannamei TaxID=6689 RepID=A0A423U2P3_PENVA|nr:uncharacterized protein LOC113800190 [Penaeus vannamei]ROT82980.1 hypothetical protein C7M84_023842 [Penaeus vannamei]
MRKEGLPGARPSTLALGLVLAAAALSLATPGVDAQASRRAREVGSEVPLRFAGGRDASLPSVAAISGSPLNQPVALNRNNPFAAAPPIVFGPKIRRRPWRFWF